MRQYARRVTLELRGDVANAREEEGPSLSGKSMVISNSVIHCPYATYKPVRVPRLIPLRYRTDMDIVL
jgi:hypothetical protein